nr:diaminopimelate epimerase [uncultured Sellimonas sp.]
MHFVKMEGCGNDYIYVELEHETVPNPQRLARKISDRHFGVGADGLILIAPSDQADCRMEMYNADGSRGRMCGNGVRCVARYLYDYKKIRKQEISVETDSGIHKVRILEDSQKATVRMGAPLIEETAHVISMEGQKTEMTIVSMGNPHAVIFMTPEEGSWKTWDMKKAAAISTHSDFPEGINVELVQVYSETGMKVRVWERGSNETLSCGSGACAAAAAAIRSGRTKQKVNIEMPGGMLEVEWKEDGELYLTGGCRFVCEGEYPGSIAGPCSEAEIGKA